MKRASTGFVVLVCAFLATASAQEAPQYRELKGSTEFSGRMIARPVQPEIWLERGLALVESQQRADQAQHELERYEILNYVPQTDETILKVSARQTENDVAGTLMATGLFQYVEPDWIVFPIACPNDPQLGSQWHHDQNRMQSCDGWDFYTGDPGTAVGYCDTGLLTTHEDLQLHRREAYNAVDRIWESNGGNIGPVHEHGTWVTGCGSGNGDNGVGISGVGWNLGHRMLRVSNNSSGSSSSSTLQHAARTAIENGDKVASVSYSGVDSNSNLSTASYIKSIGGLLCWSAGNDGRNLTFGDRDADDLIVCGATDQSDNKAGFSAFGRFVDLTAPGVSVYTSGASAPNDYDAVSGTSFSCPLTAGLCALIWSADPSLTPDEVELILKTGCDDLGSSGIDNTFGYGRIDVHGALLQVRTLSFDYPNGRPDVLDPTGGTVVRVVVGDNGVAPVPGTGMLHVNDGSGWISAPMTEIVANVYDGTFPGFPGLRCGSLVEWYVSADGNDGQTHSNPAGAPGSSWAATTDTAGADIITLVDLNFETRSGWRKENENLETGPWQLGVPAGGGSRGDPTTDYDGSGQCWITGNTVDEDVDGGPTRLISPAYDLSQYNSARVSYARWFTTDDGNDFMVVQVSKDDGASWSTVESIGNSSGWNISSFDPADFGAMSNLFRIRFNVSDNPNDSVTEAGLDAFKIEAVVCPLLLDASPEVLALGDSFTLTLWTGLPSTPGLIFLSSVNGSPISIFLAISPFDANGNMAIPGQVPNDAALSGLDIGLTGYGLNELGFVKASPEEVISIQ